MIKWLYNNYAPLPPIFIDGALYVGIALFSSLLAAFSSDDAAKYIEPMVLFWLKTVCTALNGICIATKMFRSTAFAEHQQAKKDSTTQWRRAQDATAAKI